MYTINCRGKLINIDQPMVMGIINVTHDSFYEGHLNAGEKSILLLVEKMISEGVDMIDLGAQSTRPGSTVISAAEEMDRLIPIIEAIIKNNPDLIISVDTYYSSVATTAVHSGASIINDISAGNFDELMLETVAKLKVPYVCMHMKGTPQNMQQQATYHNLMNEMLEFFIDKIHSCKKAGIMDIIIDPGFGFGKTIAHNFQLLKQLDDFAIL